MTEHSAPVRWARDWWVAAVTWAAGATVFNWRPLTSGFDKIVGNQGDARLVVALHEHWLQVLAGRAGWRDPGFFYPARGVLGYSDTFLLNMAVYGPLRALGLDQWAALQVSLILLSLIGFAATFSLMRRMTGAGRLTASALAAVFVFGNNMAVSADHPQLASVNWLPVVMLLLWQSDQATGRLTKAAMSASAGALFGLVLYSAYYVGWLAVLALTVFVIVLIVVRALSGSLSELLQSARRQGRSAVVFAAGLLVGLVPAVLTYVPVLDDSERRPYLEVMTFAPRPLDVLNVGGGNHLWGSTMNRLMGSESARLRNGEISLSPTPMLLLTVIIVGVAVARRRRRSGGLAEDALVAGAITVPVLMLLPVNWDDWSLWVVPWNVVPGAVGIRAAGRLQLITGLVACLVVAGGLHRLFDLRRSDPPWRPRPALIVPVLLLALLAEQHNVRDNARLDRSAERRAAASVPDPPAACRWFFMAPERGRPPYVIGTDAALLAVRTGLPTINGYSGTLPRGYAIDPSSPGYFRQVQAWARERGISTGACIYDRVEREWSTASVADAEAATATVDPR